MTNNISDLIFEEDQSTGYSSRTYKNAQADVTLAIAVNFSSAGEMCTLKAVRSACKKYIAYGIAKEFNIDNIEWLTNFLNTHFENKEISINIAGNGIYSLSPQYTQEVIDEKVYLLLEKIVLAKKFDIKLIRSGGQTGIDEAGIKAAIKIGIPALVLAPKGWKFRDKLGKDISNENLFKKRFIV